MAEQTIDKISLDIQASTDAAVRGIDNLINSFKELNTSSSSTIKNLKEQAQGLNALARSITVLDSKYKQGTKNVNSFSTSINTLQSSMKSLSTNSLNKVVNGFEKLSSISNITNSFSQIRINVNELNKSMNVLTKAANRLPSIISSFERLDLSKFEQQMQELTRILKPFNDAMGNASNVIRLFGSSVTAMPRNIDRLENKIDALTNKTQRFSKALKAIQFANMLYIGVRAFNFITQSMGYFIGKSNDYIENINLFSVAMGEYAIQGERFINSLTGLGIDPAQATQFMGLFNQISKSLGLTSENAYTLSENFTKLTYDLASFYNISTESAFDKLKAGLTGETEPLRALGIVITENNLAETAMTLGIEKSIRTMTEAEKIQLRYITVMRQSINAHNDLEKTIYTPANALRVLQAQLGATAREIGNVFIPILIKVIPYVIAFVQVIGELIGAFASFLGFELPQIENTFSGVSDALEPAEDGTENMSDNLDSANNSAKELRKQLMGFDELNVLTTPSSSAGGGGGTGIEGTGIGDLLDFDLSKYGYDELIKGIGTQVDDLKKKVISFIDTVFPYLNLAISTILGFKIASKVLELSKIFTKLGGSIGSVLLSPLGLLGIALTFVIFTLVQAFKSSESFRGGLVAIGEGIMSLVGPSSSFGTLTAMLFDFESGLGLVTTGLIGFGLSMLTANPIFMIIAGALAVIIETVKMVGRAFEDSIQPVNIFGDNISELTKEKVQPFMDDMNELEVMIGTQTWANKILTDEDVQRIGEKAKEISTGILDELSADRNNDLNFIETLRGVVDEEEINRIITDTEQLYTDMETKVREGEEKLNQLNIDYQEGRITSAEEYNTEVEKIMDGFYEVGITAYSEYSSEAQSILQTLNNEAVTISQNQAADIIKNAKKTKEDSIKEIEGTYLDQVELYTKLRENASEENKGMYDEYITQAGVWKNEQLGIVEEQWQSVVDTTKEKMGDQKNAIDYETGEINTKYQKGMKDLRDGASKVWTWIVGDAETGTKDVGGRIGDHMKDWLSPLQEWGEDANESVEKTWKWVVGDTETGTKDVGGRIGDQMKEWLSPLQDWGEDASESVEKAWTWIVGDAETGTKNVLERTKENIPKWLEPVTNWKENLTTAIDKAWKWVVGDSETGTKSVGGRILDNIGSWIQPVIDWGVDIWNDIKEIWENKIKPWFTWDKWYNIGKDAIQYLADSIWNGLTGIGTWITTKIDEKIVGPVRGMVKSINTLLGNIDYTPAQGAGGIQLPGGRSVGYSLQGGSLTINQFATGGFPDAGSLFLAGEKGAELLGRYKNKNTVMPLENSDFVDAMYDAVYDAVSDVFGEQETQDIILNVGEEQLAKATINGINRVTRKTGKNLLKL